MDWYSLNVDRVVAEYERHSFEEIHAGAERILPSHLATVFDVGAGTGRDAAWFAASGHTVYAVEPSAELREAGKAIHGDVSINWIDDRLPGLHQAGDLGVKADVMFLSAVWNHLDENQQVLALARITDLMSSNGLVMISLRHGPSPAGRRFHAVEPDALRAQAGDAGLDEIWCREMAFEDDLEAGNGVSWTRVWFRKRSPPARTVS